MPATASSRSSRPPTTQSRGGSARSSGWTRSRSRSVRANISPWSPTAPPELPRSARLTAALTAVGATASAAFVMSVVQLFVGDALLPRFVVLGSAAVLVPWYVLSAALARDERARASGRDRVLVVAAPDEVATLRAEL